MIIIINIPTTARGLTDNHWGQKVSIAGKTITAYGTELGFTLNTARTDSWAQNEEYSLNTSRYLFFQKQKDSQQYGIKNDETRGKALTHTPTESIKTHFMNKLFQSDSFQGERVSSTHQ